MKEGALLDEIAKVAQKSCLSDLHKISMNDLIAAIKKVDADKFSLDEWSYAISYIKGSKTKLQEVGDIEKMLRIKMK